MTTTHIPYALLAMLLCVGFPALALYALGAPMPRFSSRRMALLWLAVAIYASIKAYVQADEKPQPPEPPEPPPGPYVPGGTWESMLHIDPFSGTIDTRIEYRLPPSAPEVPIEKEHQ